MKKRTSAAIQAPNFERDHAECLSCGEVIHHPLCPKCISKGFKEWALKFPELIEIEGKLRKFIREHKHKEGNPVKCIHCGNHSVNLCPYCFTEHLYDLIKNSGAKTGTLSEFLFIFNFDFEHRGYSEELESMGSY